MSSSVLDRHHPGARSSPRHVRGVRWIALAAVVAVVAGATAAVVTVHGNQQSALQRNRAQLAAAVGVFQSAMSSAEAGGVTADALLPVWRQERAVVGRPRVPARWLLFDGGEIQRVAQEAAAVGGLVGKIDTIEAAAIKAEQETAAPVLAQLSSAISAASAAGLDETTDTATLAAAQQGVLGAASPKAVLAAVTGLSGQAASITQKTAAKIAADAALEAAKEDAASSLARADQLLSNAQQHPQLQLTALAAQVAAAHASFTAATTVDAYNSAGSSGGDAGDAIAALLASRSTAYQDMATARQDVTTAVSDKVDPGTASAQLDALQVQLDATGTGPQFDAIDTQIMAISGPLEDKIAVATLGVGKVILISLANQTLDAYNDGNKVIDTLVTTGQPALPTPPGNYTVLRKNSPWEMVSDWPPGTIGWYAPSWVQWVLWFRDDGYGIHDAPWRSTYGPGTEESGSHGCVNVPAGPMQLLYNWADVGTRVIVR